MNLAETRRKRSAARASSSGKATAPCTSVSPRNRWSASAASIRAFASLFTQSAASKSPRPPTRLAQPKASSKLSRPLRQALSGVGTEIHLVNRLGKEFKNHKVISLDPSVCVCTTMFRITPQHLLWALENLGEGNVVNRITVDERTRHHARVALDRMLALR